MTQILKEMQDDGTLRDMVEKYGLDAEKALGSQMLNNEKITKIIARRYIWLPFLMGVLLGIVCFVVFTGYDRMKIEKIADETLDFMQDRVKNMMTTKIMIK